MTVFGIERALARCADPPVQKAKKRNHPALFFQDARLQCTVAEFQAEFAKVKSSAPRAYRRAVILDACDDESIIVRLYYIANGAWSGDHKRIMEAFDGEWIADRVREQLCGHVASTADCTLGDRETRAIKQNAAEELDKYLAEKYGA